MRRKERQVLRSGREEDAIYGPGVVRTGRKEKRSVKRTLNRRRRKEVKHQLRNGLCTEELLEL